jgi:hypothetical protein
VAGDVEDAVEARVPRPHGLVADVGQDPELQGEHDLPHERDPEQRRGVEHERQRGDRAVRPSPGAPRGEHPHEHPQRQRHREGRPREEQGGGQPVEDEVEDGPLLAVREAEIQVTTPFM